MNGGYQATISASDAPPWALTIALDEDNLKLCHTWPVHGPGEGGGGEGGGGWGLRQKKHSLSRSGRRYVQFSLIGCFGMG